MPKEPSPWVIVGGALAVLGLVMTTIADRPRYVKEKLDRYMVEGGFVFALLGGIALVIGAGEELGKGRSLLGYLTLLGVAIGILLILIAPNVVSCCARYKRNRVRNGPNAVPASKPPALRGQDGGDDEVDEHQRRAV